MGGLYAMRRINKVKPEYYLAFQYSITVATMAFNLSYVWGQKIGNAKPSFVPRKLMNLAQSEQKSFVAAAPTVPTRRDESLTDLPVEILL